MSITSTSRRNNYSGDNSTLVWAYTFKLFSRFDVEVKVRNKTTGVETPLVLTTDYTVEFVGIDQGGTITLVSAGQAWISTGLSSNYEISIRLHPVLAQDTDIKNNTKYLASLHERRFDKDFQTFLDFQDQLDRSIKLPSSIDPSDFSTDLPSDIIAKGAGKYFAVKSDATGIELVDGTATDLSGIQSEVDNIELEIVDIEAEIDDLNTAIAALEAEIAALVAGTVVESTGNSAAFEVYGSSSAGSQTYNSRAMRWIKTGKKVSVEVYADMSAHTGTGAIRIPLPYAVAGGGSTYGVPVLYGSMKPANGYMVQATIAPSENYVELAQFKPSAGVSLNLGNIALNMEDMDSTVSFGFRIEYEAANNTLLL